MNFLFCTPSVFVIGKEYELLINMRENGICSVQIGDEIYYEENSGVLSSEKKYAKIRVPQKWLDEACAYRIIYRRCIRRKAYRSELAEEEYADFDFKPIKKSDNINIYHIADVHYNFEPAIKTAAFFGDELDLLIINGDIGEVMGEDSFPVVSRFVGVISGGRIPVIFTRGNHDTRGMLAERFTDYFPSNNKATYYEFEIGPISGVVLDCGEDKADDCIEYGGVNRFGLFRRREAQFLKRLPALNRKFNFAVCHALPSLNASYAGGKFDIDRDTYSEWIAELSRIGIDFMLCGHLHKTYVLEPNSEKSLLPHAYPIVVGSALCRKADESIDIWGAAITLSGKRMHIRFTDSDLTVQSSCELDLQTGTILQDGI